MSATLYHDMTPSVNISFHTSTDAKPRLNKPTIELYRWIVRLSEKYGYCFSRNAYLAEKRIYKDNKGNVIKMGCSKSQISRAIQSLVEAGWFRVDFVYHNGKRERRLFPVVIPPQEADPRTQTAPRETFPLSLVPVSKLAEPAPSSAEEVHKKPEEVHKKIAKSAYPSSIDESPDEKEFEEDSGDSSRTCADQPEPTRVPEAQSSSSNSFCQEKQHIPVVGSAEMPTDQHIPESEGEKALKVLGEGHPVKLDSLYVFAKNAGKPEVFAKAVQETQQAKKQGKIKKSVFGFLQDTLMRKLREPATAPVSYQGYDNRGYDNRGYDNRGYDNRGYDKKREVAREIEALPMISQTEIEESRSRFKLLPENAQSEVKWAGKELARKCSPALFALGINDPHGKKAIFSGIYLVLLEREDIANVAAEQPSHDSYKRLRREWEGQAEQREGQAEQKTATNFSDVQGSAALHRVYVGPEKERRQAELQQAKALKLQEEFDAEDPKAAIKNFFRAKNGATAGGSILAGA